MALYLSRRHVRAKPVWSSNRSAYPDHISGLFSTRSPYVAISGGSGNTIWAASPAVADIQAAHTAAANLDTIMVPAGTGTATWEAPLEFTKGVQVIGPGVGSLRITKGHTGHAMRYVPANPDANYPFRFSGFYIDQTLNRGPGLRLYTASNVAQTSIRIDHNRVEGGAPFLSCRYDDSMLGGNFYGVVDNNYVVVDSESNAMSWIGAVGQGMWNWSNRVFNRGSADMMFFEDNTVYGRSFLGDCGLGMRYCARYNTIYNTSAINMTAVFDCHGNQRPSGHTAGMGFEVYHNNLYANNQYCQFLEHRGGRCMAFYNTIHNALNIDMNCREEFLDNYNPEVEPFAVMSDPDIYAEQGQPMHPSGSYYWENRRGTGELLFRTNTGIDYSGVPEIWCFDGEGMVPTEDRHFWQQKASFDGSSGIGVGPMSSRPVSCTGNGVAWWDNVNNVLYRWRTGFGWEEFYRPYTYPHPLRGE